MSRRIIKPVKQPDEISCGPAALKTVAMLLGLRVSLKYLKNLCRTTRNGTLNGSMKKAVKALKLSYRFYQNVTLKDIRKLLKKTAKLNQALLVNYLYSKNENKSLDKESGHWTVIASYSPSRQKITILDSYTGKRKSYAWPDFRKRWVDYEDKRIYNKTKTRYRIREIITKQPLFLISRPPISRGI